MDKNSFDILVLTSKIMSFGSGIQEWMKQNLRKTAFKNLERYGQADHVTAKVLKAALHKFH